MEKQLSWKDRNVCTERDEEEGELAVSPACWPYTVDIMASACLCFYKPQTPGQVSFYNDSCYCKLQTRGLRTPKSWKDIVQAHHSHIVEIHRAFSHSLYWWELVPEADSFELSKLSTNCMGPHGDPFCSLMVMDKLFIHGVSVFGTFSWSFGKWKGDRITENNLYEILDLTIL